MRALALASLLACAACNPELRGLCSFQSDCPAEQVTHSQLPSDPWVMALVRQSLGTTPLTSPPPPCKP